MLSTLNCCDLVTVGLCVAIRKIYQPEHLLECQMTMSRLNAVYITERLFT